MAENAASKALASAGVSADDIDLVIGATCTMPTSVPAAAPQLATRLGIPAPGAYDVNSGCSGFVYALNAAAAAVRTGQARNVLVVASERFSGWIDFARPDHLHHLGRRRRGRGRRHRPTRPRSARSCGAATARRPTSSPSTRRPASSGRRARLSTAGPPRRWRRWRSRPAGRRASTRPTLAAFVPHQANLRIIDALAKKLNAPERHRRPRHRRCPATPRLRRSRWRCRRWSNGARSRPAPPSCCWASARIAYASQVVLAP